MHHLLGVRRFAGVLLVSMLSACSGGSGDDSDKTSVTLSTRALDFRAQITDTAAPAAQVVTATVGSDIAHVAVVHSGTAIAEVSSSLSGNTAQITIEPNVPEGTGPGAFSGAVAVTGYVCADAACTAFAPRDTQTIVVSYQVSPVVQFVAPYVATAGTSSNVILRGIGFQGFAVSGATFGSAAATSVTLGDEDIIMAATHPALAAGSYPVRLDIATHKGEVPSTATLVVVEPIAYPAETLAYPAANPAVRRLIYDAERSALLVATDTNGGTILRYEYAGGAWSAAESVALSDLQDAALSIDGTQLLAISRTALIPLDPATLVAGTAIAAASLAEGSFLKNITLANDNRAVITTGINASTATNVYVYDVGESALERLGTTLNNATAGVSGNATNMVLIQGDPALTTDPAVVTYEAITDAFANSAVTLKQTAIAPVLDRATTRIVLNGVRVYNTSFSLLGTLPSTTLAVVLSADGKRAYTYDSAAAGVLTFDISTDEDGAAYAPLGSAVAPAGDPGAGVKMAISPDGGTLFLAGSTQLVIQPTP